MNWKLVAALACSAALLVGACSGGNPPAGPGAGSETPDVDPNGGTPDDDNGDDDNGDSGAAERDRLQKQAEDAIGLASGVDPARARTEIENARKAIDDAVAEAQREYDASRASATTTSTQRLAAYDRLTRLTALQRMQTRRLDDALASLAWYGTRLVRFKLADGAAVVPAETTADVERTNIKTANH